MVNHGSHFLLLKLTHSFHFISLGTFLNKFTQSKKKTRFNVILYSILLGLVPLEYIPAYILQVSADIN